MDLIWDYHLYKGKQRVGKCSRDRGFFPPARSEGFETGTQLCCWSVVKEGATVGFYVQDYFNVFHSQLLFDCRNRKELGGSGA